MACGKTVLLILTVLSISSTSKVKWLPNTSFNLAANFRDHKLPCSKQTVIFPEWLQGSVRIESGTEVSGFVLPTDGNIYLGNGFITLGADSKEINCTNTDDVYYMDRTVSYWTQPDAWSSPAFNEATPDAERIPCYNDVVEFPKNSQFTVQLPHILQDVRQITVDGKDFTTTKGFSDYINNDITAKFLLSDSRVTISIAPNGQCLSRAGCPCQHNELPIRCTDKFCPTPTCIDPIKPIGHCCRICGGFISFGIDESFDMTAFNKLVEANIASYGRDEIVYHIGRLPYDRVQVVIVEKGQYRGVSAQVANSISYQIQDHEIQGSKQLFISGGPLSSSGFGFKITISMFFTVLLLMIGIYVYYYKSPSGGWARYTLPGRSADLFSRPQRRTDSMVSLTRRDSSVALGSGRRAFRNPLYDSKRERVVVTESVLEE